MKEIIVILLALLVLVVLSLGDSIEKEALSPEERQAIVEQEEREAAAKELYAQQQAERQQALADTPWSDVTAENRSEWILAQLFSGWIGGGLIILVLVTVIFNVFSKMQSERY